MRATVGCLGRVCLTLVLCATFSACADGAGRAVPADAGEADPAEFLRAYESGFAAARRDAKDDAATSGPRAPAERAAADQGHATDVGFPTFWKALSSVDVPDVETYVASGQADAWLDLRMRELGYTPRDVVSANALLFLSNWEAYTGMRPTAAQAAGARRQVATHWTQQGAGESPEEIEVRRRVYELMAATLSRENGRLRAEGNPGAIDAFAATVRADFQRQSNNDLAAIELTDAGFEDR